MCWPDLAAYVAAPSPVQVHLPGRLMTLGHVHSFVRIKYNFPRSGAFICTVYSSRRRVPPTYAVLVRCMWLLVRANGSVTCSIVMVFARSTRDLEGR